MDLANISIKTASIVLFAILTLVSCKAAISAENRALPPDLLFAAKKNADLKFSLRWSLGRKRQTGWYLYVSLIQKAINTQKNENSVGFARGVYEWQKNKRIAANGIVNRQTLYSFIAHWQSQRVKPIVLAKDYQLLTASISDFYDRTRDIELLKLEKRTYAAYRKMIAAATGDTSLGLKLNRSGTLAEKENFLKIVSSYRSPKYQASLRKKQPGASRAQIAFKSPHFTGRALDIYVGGEPVTTKDFNRAIQVKTPVYKWLVKNAEKFGFYPYFYEPWHWEYVPENRVRPAK